MPYINRLTAQQWASQALARIALRGPAEVSVLARFLRSQLDGRPFAERRRLATALARVRPTGGPAALGIDSLIRVSLSVA